MDNDNIADIEIEPPGPVSTVQEDTAPSTDVLAVADDNPAEEETPKRRNRRDAHQRIAQLTAKSRDLERQLAEARQPQPQAQPEAAVNRDDFDDYESFIEAKAENKARQAAAAYIAQENQTRAEREQQAHAVEAQSTFDSTRDDVSERGTEEFEDFVSITQNQDLHISPTMGEAILSSDDGHRLWHHLGNNPKIAEKISAMPPINQLMELGKLSANLAGGKTASAAPPPRKPNRSSGSSNNGLSDNLETGEWIKRRNAEVHR